MLLMLMRHGKAVPREEAGSDEARWLTEEGRREVEAVAQLLPAKPTVIYTSPLRRARETADIVARVTGAGVMVTEELAPSRVGCRSLEKLRPQPGSLLVTHSPGVEEMLCCLIGGGDVALAPGAVAIVEAEKPAKKAGRLVELITPRLALAALGAQRP